MKNWTSKSLLTLAGFSLLGGCGHMTSTSMDMMQSQNAAAEMAMVEASQTQSVVTLKDVLDADSQDIPTLTAIGYAVTSCLLYTSPSPRDLSTSRMPSSA